MRLYTMTVGDFYEHIVSLCRKHSASMNSGFRTTSRNRRARGHVRSRHKDGRAFDLEPDENTRDRRERLAAAARELGLKAIVDHKKKYVHVACL